MSEWKSRGLSDEVLKLPATSNKIPIPMLIYFSTKTKIVFSGIYLNQDKITYTYGTIANIYIVYEIFSSTNDFNFALENCLFGPVKVTKNSDFDKYR